MDESTLLASLQAYVDRNHPSVKQLSGQDMVKVMIGYFRSIKISGLAPASSGDTLLYQYGSLGLGCGLGFTLSLHRQILRSHRADEDPQQHLFLVGISLIFPPSRYEDVQPFQAQLRDADSLDAFVAMIKATPGFQTAVVDTASEVKLEALLASSNVGRIV